MLGVYDSYKHWHISVFFFFHCYLFQILRVTPFNAYHFLSSRSEAPHPHSWRIREELLAPRCQVLSDLTEETEDLEQQIGLAECDFPELR